MLCTPVIKGSFSGSLILWVSNMWAAGCMWPAGLCYVAPSHICKFYLCCKDCTII
jgi:hypothetical protein